MKKLLLLVSIVALFASCSHNKTENVERAFYYWKSQSYMLSENESAIVHKLGAKKVYVKFFEVENSATMGIIPTAKSNFKFYNNDSISVIPTVYIRNEVFLTAAKSSLDTLADNVNFLIRKYYKERSGHGYTFALTEFQMDCDWTLKTKENYFYFLQKLKAISKMQISCTLRLYPYKYPEKMGIPPVDKVMLMCYNLSNPLESPTKNSILDIDELSAYLNVKRKYPLHLDIALPVYSWMQVYQNNRFVKVLPGNGDSLKPPLKPLKKLWYEATEDKIVDNFYLRAGDKIKVEEITAADIERAIAIIKENVVLDKNITVSLFHLDDQQLKKYSNATLSGFYSAFTK
ncbi:MAG: hypothetical protein PSV16_03280 [Flavobacterium sp.]|nr:hypothetical protein [Flavobacterium sp.]